MDFSFEQQAGKFLRADESPFHKERERERENRNGVDYQ